MVLNPHLVAHLLITKDSPARQSPFLFIFSRFFRHKSPTTPPKNVLNSTHVWVFFQLCCTPLENPRNGYMAPQQECWFNIQTSARVNVSEWFPTTITKHFPQHSLIRFRKPTILGTVPGTFCETRKSWEFSNYQSFAIKIFQLIDLQ